jgi:hypothetical protein
MNHNTLDRWVHRLDASVPRRRALVVVAGALGLGLNAQDGLGKSKKHKHHHTHPPKQQPQLASAYTCPGNPDFSVGTSGDVPLGQRFTATRGGTLRQIRVGVVKDDVGGSGDYLVQLLRTTGDPAAPGTRNIDVLAAAVIRDGDVPLGTSTVVADFAATDLVQGTVYAVMVSRPGAGEYNVQAFDGGDFCEGVMTDIGHSSTFPRIDMIVSVLVN